jgi:hypothetical protein
VSRRARRPLLAALVAAGIVAQLSCAAAMAAAQGVALDTGRINVETPLVPGKSYQLAKISVRNPGTLRTTYDLVVTPIKTSANTPQASWVSFSPKQITVKGGKQQAVTVSIRVPKNAAAGAYEVLVGARVAPAANGMAISAGAAARLTFSVAGPLAVEPVVSVLETWWPLPAAALLVAALVLVRGRFRLRLPIERRSA